MVVMKHKHLMTGADRIEWDAIGLAVNDAAKRRAKLFNKLRQRAWRERTNQHDS